MLPSAACRGGTLQDAVMSHMRGMNKQAIRSFQLKDLLEIWMESLLAFLRF